MLAHKTKSVKPVKNFTVFYTLLHPLLYTKHPRPTALTESLFYDNPEDLRFLESTPGRQAIINLHVRGIIDYANEFYK